MCEAKGHCGPRASEVADNRTLLLSSTKDAAYGPRTQRGGLSIRRNGEARLSGVLGLPRPGKENPVGPFMPIRIRITAKEA